MSDTDTDYELDSRTIASPSRLSWSSLVSYSECGERWRLERGHKVSRSTWFATVAGSAIHEITEQIDRHALANRNDFDAAWQAAEPFATVFSRLLSEETGEVKASGRKLQKMGKTGGPNKKDREWWMHYGPIYVGRWVAFRKMLDWEIAVMPDGEPGIEVEFEVEVNGDLVKGYIDRVFYDPDTGQLIVVDLKTGKEPAGSLQLATYKMGLYHKYGLTPALGAFWLPAEGDDDYGKLTPQVWLDDFDLEYVEGLLGMARTGIEAGVFLPNVTNMCSGCSVRDFCRAVGGSKADTLPIRSNIFFPDTGEVAVFDNSPTACNDNPIKHVTNTPERYDV